MRALITGADGQLAHALMSAAPAEVDLHAVNRAECDITEPAIVAKVVNAFRPDIVINTAAYTAVDDAEDNQELAFRVNANGAGIIAKAANLVGSQLVHISTDYVFDGLRTTPYAPDAPTNPINVYGASKLAGEQLVLNAAPSAAIVRTGWLYSSTGQSFLARILAALRDGRSLSVVSDQQGCPTSAHEFALALWDLAALRLFGVYHWANWGSGTWYDFAREIGRIALELELISRLPDIRPVTAAEYARGATRPAYSVLDPTKLAMAINKTPSVWKQALRNDMTRGL